VALPAALAPSQIAAAAFLAVVFLAVVFLAVAFLAAAFLAAAAVEFLAVAFLAVAFLAAAAVEFPGRMPVGSPADVAELVLAYVAELAVRDENTEADRMAAAAEATPFLLDWALASPGKHKRRVAAVSSEWEQVALVECPWFSSGMRGQIVR